MTEVAQLTDAARDFAVQWKQGTLNLRECLHLPQWVEIIPLAAAHLSREDDERSCDRFVQEIINANSAYEDLLHRDLLMASCCVGRGAVVSKDLENAICSSLDNAFSPSVAPLNDAIAEALASLSASRGQSAILEIAKQKSRNRSPQMRLAAASVLGRLAERSEAMEDAIEGLAGLLRDEDERVRAQAARWLGGIGERAGTAEIIAALRELLLDPDNCVWCAAGYTLGSLGERAATPEIVDWLIGLLHDADRHMLHVVGWTFGCMGGQRARTPGVLDALQRLVRDNEPRIRAEAAEVLGSMAATAQATELQEVLMWLQDLLSDSEAQVRAAAARALGSSGDVTPTPKVVALLVEALRDTDSDLRSAGSWALGRMGERAATSEVLGGLVVLLRWGRWEKGRQHPKWLGDWCSCLAVVMDISGVRQPAH
ncbi:MAG: HEAT repeat domain-containing protein [Armatimonadetes bacterium]|nr:HEAT repeat domain-containing protein [Armatimonadota bacterium]